MAWFGRKLTTATPEASLSFEELVAGWRAVIEQEIPDSSNRQRYCFSLFRSSIEVLLTELNKQKKRVTSFLFMSIYSFSLT